MKAITYDRIQVEGGLGIQELHEFSMSIRPNQHAKAKVKGTVQKETCLREWQNSLETHVVKIYLLDENGKCSGQPFFSGYMKDVTLNSEDGYHEIELEIWSGTIALDRERKCASYQDVSQSYSMVLKKAIKDTDKAAAICTAGQEKKPEKPFIQYMETNWEFALRLASHLHTVIYPEVKEPRPWFWFGKSNPCGKKKIESSTYMSGISSRFYELGGMEKGYKKQDFLYYKVKTYENFEMGTAIQYQGRDWMICEKTAELVRNELVFTYILGSPQFVALRKRYNPVFAGMSILGKVISTGGETLKIHLDIDKEQEKSTAYDYEWTPDTGSVMYCMPKVGTTVSLYFSSSDEMSARAVSCIRENGASCQAMSDPSKRALNTEHGKQMYLNPDAMGFTADASGNKILVEDEKGISLESRQKISIVAGEQVRFEGKTVILDTPTNMRLARK